jgi:hypothetical protein
MSMIATLTWLQDQSLPTQIRESDWMFPTIETVHVFALVLVVGSILTVDLRLLNLVNRERPFRQLAGEMLPWTWAAFAVAALAGSMMFSSKAVTYWGNIPFRIKMVCLLFAAMNMLTFQFLGSRRVADWDTGRPPAAARLAGLLSLLLWTAIVATGRWIGFTT